MTTYYDSAGWDVGGTMASKATREGGNNGRGGQWEATEQHQ